MRVASSLKFTYTDDGLLRYYVFFRGKRRAPSVLVDMSLAEFTERSRPGCSLPSLIYPPGTERYYLQSALTADLRKDIDLRQKPFSIAAAAGTRLQIILLQAAVHLPQAWNLASGHVGFPPPDKAKWHQDTDL